MIKIIFRLILVCIIVFLVGGIIGIIIDNILLRFVFATLAALILYISSFRFIFGIKKHD
ncbi:hypothetical protein LCGC14_3136520 [marine sediment metagenome]|uniref:Uncharacterized protein n=1 Tax=marine sediment metagenome TaxID=412755 RepID=A0A0F8WM18_9ZZZZ